MKVMKSMKKKAKKASGMKKMKKAMRVSIVGKGKFSKVLVFRGTNQKTVGGLKKADLVKNKHGRIVSKKQSARGGRSKWMAATKAARAALKVKGFCPVGGKSQ